MKTFKDLPLNPEIQLALEGLGFTHPTEIQEKAIPLLLAAEKMDIFGQAQTGTGKTLAFGLPLIQKINPSIKQVQALIVALTRELVGQIRDSLRQITKNSINIEAIYGGVSMQEQMFALKRGVHIIVGTPGRLNDHLRRRTLSLNNLKTLVLDEADTMLDMGFKEEVDEILACMPGDRQIWLFSATTKQGINDLMRSHMKDPVSIIVSRKEISAQTTKQYYAVVSRQARQEALCRFIDNAPEFYGFIFCQTKMLTAEVCEKLTKRGYSTNALHGDMSQAQRNQVIKRFKKKEFAILVATDVAARGIDVSDATHVVNFSLPEDQESYVHRIGRTGRAGKDGIAITFVGPSELRRLRSTALKFKFDVQPLEVPRMETIANLQQDKALATLVSSSKKLAVNNKFIENLFNQVSQYSKEDLAFAVANNLYDKYLSPIVSEKEIEIPQYSSEMGGQHQNNDEALCEFFIGVGEDDGVTKGDVVDYLVSSQKVTQNQIRKIKLLRKHTFAVVPTAQAQDIITALYGLPLNGRKIRISITNEVPQLNDFDRAGSSDRPFRRRSSEGRGSESRGGGSFNRGGGRSRSNSYSSSHAQY